MISELLTNEEREKYDSFIGKFPIKQESGNQLRAVCPVCGKDKLYISVGRNSSGEAQILIDCKHKCSYKDILNAKGIKPKELYLSGKKKNWKDCADIREHIYCDEKGEPVAKKVIYKFHSPCDRFSIGEKTALWYRYENGGFNKKAGLGKFKPPLYHLDRISGSDTVYIAEGEKDAETLEKMGFTATTSPNGAGSKWKAEYNSFLSGKNCIVLSDNDDAGTKAGHDTVGSLCAAGIQVRLISAKEIYPDVQNKGDISDIASAVGFDKAREMLCEAVERSKLYEIPETVTSAENSVCSEYGSDVKYLTRPVLEAYFSKYSIKIRTNIITHDMEIDSPVKFTEYSKAALPQVIVQEIIDDFKVNYPDYKGVNIQNVSSVISNIALLNTYNPLLEMINSTKWDGIGRFPELCKMLTIENDSLSMILLRKWLMQSYAILMNSEEEPFDADGVLVLCGAQGFGKTQLLKALALHPNYFGEGRCYDPRNKDSTIQLTSKWICELGEIGSTLRKDIDLLKAFITNSTDEYRLPYARTYQTSARRTSFCGSTNDMNFLVDETGNRRFWTIRIDDNRFIDIKGDTFRNFDFLQLWAEVKVIVDNELKRGETLSGCFRLTREEVEQLNSLNKNHSKALKGEQEIADILSMIQEPRNGYEIREEYFTATDFKMRYSDELRNFTADNIGRVLRKLGYEPRKMRMDGVPSTVYKLPARIASEYLSDKKYKA